MGENGRPGYKLYNKSPGVLRLGILLFKAVLHSHPPFINFHSLESALFQTTPDILIILIQRHSPSTMENNNRSRPRGRAPHLHLETPGHQSLNSFPASHSHRQAPTHTAQDTFNSGMMSGTARGTSRFSPQMLSPGQNEIDGYHNNSRWSSQSGYLPEKALEHQVGLWLSSQESSTYPNNSALMTGSHRSGSQMLPYSPESLQPFEHLGGFSWVPSDPGAQVPLQSPEEPRSAMMAPPQNHLLPDMTRYENPHLQQYTGSSLLCTPPGSSSARYVPYPYTPRTNDSEIMPARTNKSQSIAS